MVCSDDIICSHYVSEKIKREEQRVKNKKLLQIGSASEAKQSRVTWLQVMELGEHELLRWDLRELQQALVLDHLLRL